MSKDWWKNEVLRIPEPVAEASGHKLRAMSKDTAKYMKGLSTQMKLLPVFLIMVLGLSITPYFCTV